MEKLKAGEIWQGISNALRLNFGTCFAVIAPFTLLVDMTLKLFGPAQPETMEGFTPRLVVILILVPGLIASIGQLAVAHLLLTPGTTPRAGLAAAFAAFPAYVGALLLAAIPTGLGLILLFVPGLYITARLFVMLPMAVAERLPVMELLRKSWAMTADSAWSILGFIVLGVLFVLGISLLGGGMGAALGSVLTLVGFKAVGVFMAALVPAILATVVSVGSAAAATVIYVRLAARI